MSKEKEYLESVVKAAEAVDLSSVNECIELLAEVYNENRQVFLIGCGGSSANATHFAEDLATCAIPKGAEKSLRVLSLTDNTSLITAIANDFGFDQVFTHQLRQFMNTGDVLIAISGSGNSPSIVNAAEYAKQAGGRVICMTGLGGGKLLELSDIRLHVADTPMCQSQAVHGILLHMVVDLLLERLTGELAESGC